MPKIPLLYKILSILSFAGAFAFAAAFAADGGGAGSRKNEGPVINKNGGFEEGLGAYHIVRPDDCVLDEDEVWRGQFSLRLTVSPETAAGNDDPMVVAGYTIPAPRTATPPTRYIFRCAVKTENMDPAFPARILLNADGIPGVPRPGRGLPQNEKLVFSTDRDWTPLEVELTGLPPEATVIGFTIRLPRQSKGTLRVDEIELRETTSPAAPSP
ncbi:MAG: hypothetical protein LBK99_04865 [Opitutaceae bacterium]|jgi:hypothetical protein|nr:hypothetical protein [Opitutaceae bacterium]